MPSQRVSQQSKSPRAVSPVSGHAGQATAGPLPAIKEVQAVAFYDATGRIHHMHHVVVFEGGKSHNADSAVRDAKEKAELMGRDVSGLKVLHVPHVEHPQSMHRVDAKKKVLVELEPKKSSAATTRKR
jgi:hypothetical protein